MRSNRNLLILFFSAALISGCGESELKKELSALKRDIAERRAEIEYYELQASIYAGCEFIFPICPDSVISTGRQAQQNGFGGGSDWPFWLCVLVKLLAIGAAVGGTISAAKSVWVRLGRPAQEEIDRARQMIKDSHVAQARAESREKADQERLMERKAELQRVADELHRLHLETAAAAKLLKRQQEEIESVKAAKAALAAFHT